MKTKNLKRKQKAQPGGSLKPVGSDSEKHRRLSDLHKATLFLFLIERGLPTWAEGDRQPLALVAMTGWTRKRAEAALEQCVRAGYADHPNDRGQARRENPNV